MSRLMRFVTWPDVGPERTRSLCVVGDNPFDGNLQSAFADSNFSVRQFQQDSADLENCDVLYISDSEIRNLGSVLERVEGRPILTVSDVPRFASNGGMIYLTFENRRVRFRINKTQADEVDVRLSFQLLSLADIVATN